VSIDRYIEFNPVTIAPETLLKRAVALLAQQQAENKPNCLLIVKAQKLVGILTQRDIVRMVAAETDLATTKVEMVMTQPVLTVLRSQCDNPSAVWSLIQQHDFSYIPILQDNQSLLGLVDTRSLLASFSPITLDLNQNQIKGHEQDTPKELKDYQLNNNRFQLALEKELARFFEISSIQCIMGFDGYFVRTNATLNKVLGFTPEELTNEPFINFVHPEDRVATIAELANLIAGKTTISFENRYRTKDGDYRWLLWTAKPYITEQLIYSAARDITERKNYELGIIQNINERQKAELQLQRERDFSEAIINTVGALVAVLDRQGAIVSFNRTCEQITGYCFAEVKGRQFWNFLILPQEKKAVQAVFERLLQGQFHNQYENYWLAKDGSQHLISWSNTALLDNQGQIEFIIATGIDVTEQRRVWNKLEQQYRQTKLLTETTRRIRMSIDIKEILQTTVTEIQHLLVCDRVLIMELKANQIALPISEAVLPGLPTMLGYELADPLLMGEYLTKYHQGQVLAIDDVAIAAIDPDIKQLLKQFEVQAKLVVPILSQGELKGLLVAHQCHNPRQWQEHEIQLLHQLSDQIGVALSQAQLLNYAEKLVEERTKELTATNDLLKLEIAERTQTEQELRENQQKLAGILDNADEAIISINERQQIQLFNQGAEKIFGYQASEIIGQSLDILLPQKFQILHRQHIREFAQLPEKSRQMAERNRNVYGRHKDGHEFPAEASVAKLETEAELLFTVMLRDISERQQTQEKLQTSKTLLAKAEKIAKIGSWEYDHETNQKSWSEELFNILEFEPSTNSLPTCGEILDRIHPDDLLLVQKTLRAGHQQGQAWELNYRLLLPSGKIKYIESRGEPTLNSEGKVLRVLETIMDVSERIQAEKSLLRSEEQLRLITDALPVLIAYIDDQQCYRYNNRTYESWYGRPRASLQGKSMRELVGDHNYQQMLPYIETALAGKAVTFESQPVAENGNSYWMNATFIPDLNSGGEVKGFFSMIEDITERKAVEQMKSEFISIASHEMRTPLTAIHGVIGLLAAGRLGELSESGTKMAEMALRNGDRLVRLVNDILDLERIESGQDEINRQPCNSEELIQLAIDTVAPMAVEQQIVLKTKSQSIQLLADRERIVQTLSNLISNGIKFSPANSTILISAQLVQQHVLFSVQDRGRGIPKDKLKTIFERFQQVDASDSRQKGGTGLGLAICRHIVEQHQGQIWVDSIYGEGSTFFFTLPQA
jgi:PAS domain S-box-containing protein